MTGRYPTRTGFAFTSMPAGMGSMVSRMVAERPAKSWLFNLAEDPAEQNNLADARPDKLAELMALLDPLLVLLARCADIPLQNLATVHAII